MRQISKEKMPRLLNDRVLTGEKRLIKLAQEGRRRWTAMETA
jgi:hypothetical protein